METKLNTHLVGDLNYLYENNKKIAFCISKKENGYIKQITQFTHCRETLINDMVVMMNGNNKINKKRLRLIISANCTNFNKKQGLKKILRGIKTINIICKHFNMIPITYKIINTKLLYPIVSITASPKWQRSPHMLSTFLLFIKEYNGFKFANAITYNKLITTIKNHKYIPYIPPIKKLNLFLNNYNKLFKNLSMEDNYNLENYNYKYITYIKYEGIVTLCNDISSHQILSKRFNKIVQNN